MIATLPAGMQYIDDFTNARHHARPQDRLAAVRKAAGGASSGGGLYTVTLERADGLPARHGIVLQDDMPLSSGIVYGAPEDEMWFTP